MSQANPFLKLPSSWYFTTEDSGDQWDVPEGVVWEGFVMGRAFPLVILKGLRGKDFTLD